MESECQQEHFWFGARAKGWTEHGWVFAIITPAGIYADAVMTDNGCTLIGVPSEYSCCIEILSPRHLRLTMKQAGAVSRVGDIELLDI